MCEISHDEAKSSATFSSDASGSRRQAVWRMIIERRYAKAKEKMLRVRVAQEAMYAQLEFFGPFLLGRFTIGALNSSSRARSATLCHANPFYRQG